MSNPIKPPGGPDGPDATATDPTPSVEGSPGEFRAVVDAAGADATDALAEGVRAGAVDVDQAVEQLVARALSSAQGLSGPQREKLEAQLRAALAEDPTLVALQEDLRHAKV